MSDDDIIYINHGYGKLTKHSRKQMQNNQDKVFEMLTERNKKLKAEIEELKRTPSEGGEG